MKKKRQRMYAVLELVVDFDDPEDSAVCPKGVFAKRSDANRFAKRLEKALRDEAVKARVDQGWDRNEAEDRVDEELAECARTYSVMPVPLEPEEAKS